MIDERAGVQAGMVFQSTLPDKTGKEQVFDRKIAVGCS
jgi:hypothetical protein